MQNFMPQSRLFTQEISTRVQRHFSFKTHAGDFAIVEQPSHSAPVCEPGQQDKPHNGRWLPVLIEAGAELGEPLVAASSMNNRDRG
jgi:hypothetical protein